MGKKLLFALLLASVVLAGCSAKTEVSYQRPAQYPLDNSMVYDAGLETVWDAAVTAFGKSVFVLDTVQKDSRTISLSFATEAPAEYVDCGILTYTNTGGMGADETVTIEGAAATAKYMYGDGASQPREVERRTSLEGKMDIAFSAEGKGKTRATVTARYTVNVVNTGLVPVAYGFSEGTMPSSANTSVVFNSGQTGRMHGGGLTQCAATSVLEKKILEEIRAALGSL